RPAPLAHHSARHVPLSVDSACLTSNKVALWLLHQEAAALALAALEKILVGSYSKGLLPCGQEYRGTVIVCTYYRGKGCSYLQKTIHKVLYMKQSKLHNRIIKE